MTETLEYGAFSRSVYERLGPGRVPVSGSIEVTRRCPLECTHCYNNLPMGDRAAQQGELSSAELGRILDEIAESGCLWLLLTGGEIFARRDFLDIYRHAKRKGFLITLFTNAILVTDAIADELVRWRPFSIEVTLYGRTRETYERLTRIPGSFDRAMRGIRLLHERQLPLKLKTVALTVNKHEVLDIQRFATDELGVEFKFDAMMSPRVDCSQSPLEVRLTPEECVAFDVADPSRMNEWQQFAECLPAHAEAAARQPDLLYQCGGGVNAFAIDPTGRMSICVLSHADTVDLRQGSFRDGWDHFLGAVRDRRVTRVTKCTACQMKSMCGMCPANGELENGDPESPVDFMCRVAHLRAHAFGLSVPPHGDCEYCPGGRGYDDLKTAARRVAEHPAEFVESSGPVGRGKLLPMVATATTGTGCGSCGPRI